MKTKLDNLLLSRYDRVILASKSPRRLEILRNHGVEPIVMPGNTDEALPDGISFTDAVTMLSERKAMAALELPDILKLEGKLLLIASDTIVYKDIIMGKPHDNEDAFNMLASLRMILITWLQVLHLSTLLMEFLSLMTDAHLPKSRRLSAVIMQMKIYGHI